MSLTLLGLFIGFTLVGAYIIANGYKKRELPNMAVVLFLFFIGPTTDEAFFLLSVVIHSASGNNDIALGVFQGHLYPIGFGAVAMLIGILHTIEQSFSPLFKSPT